MQTAFIDVTMDLHFAKFGDHFWVLVKLFAWFQLVMAPSHGNILFP